MSKKRRAKPQDDANSKKINKAPFAPSSRMGAETGQQKAPSSLFPPLASTPTLWFNKAIWTHGRERERGLQMEPPRRIKMDMCSNTDVKGMPSAYLLSKRLMANCTDPDRIFHSTGPLAGNALLLGLCCNKIMSGLISPSLPAFRHYPFL